MTKLFQWLFGLGIFLAVWVAVLSEQLSSEFITAHKLHVILTPVYVVISFGVYCLLLLFYRVISFNDCPEAAEELRQQIKDAKEDLRRKGFKEL